MKHNLTQVTEVFFKIGGYFGGFHKILIRKEKQGTAICAYHTEWGQEADLFSIKPFSDKDWKELLLFLTGELNVWDWKNEYINNNVCDGTEWCLGFTFSDGSQHGINGANDFPQQFDRLADQMERLYKKTIRYKALQDVQEKYLPLFWDVKGVTFHNQPH